MQPLNGPSDINPLRSGSLTVRDIFLADDNWNRYRFDHRAELRDVEIKEVEKMLLCKDERNGCFCCYCEECDEYHTQFLSCNSRLCTHCGKRYTDKWAGRLSKSMFKVPHRHFVMSMASQLWPILLGDRTLWKDIMDVAIKVLNNVLGYKTRQDLLAGAIVVLHPFGRDLMFKPHLHVILTEGGFDKKGQFVHVEYFPHKAMRKVWQYELLTRLKAVLPKTMENSHLIHSLFRAYPRGFYVYLPKETKISSTKDVSQYVGRYVRHPAIANSRISRYDGKKVTFWYENNEGRRHTITKTVDEFITSLIQHIPEPQFKMIRHYGAYCRKWSRKFRHLTSQGSITQRSINDFGRGRRIRCPKCGHFMQIICYWKKGPPSEWSFGGKIEDWIAMSG